MERKPCIEQLLKAANTEQDATASPIRRNAFLAYLAVMDPGLVVMLADTDTGSLITAAQSGAQWGYTLLSAQSVLIPIVYIV
ncbi:MAG: hypothetical protein AB7E29_01550 [Xanthobacter sp.]